MSARRIDFDGIPYLVTITRDIEQERRTEDLLQQTTRALRAISYSNRAVIHAPDEKTLLQAICGCITFEAGYRFAWVGLVQDESEWVTPMAWSGQGDGYLEEIKVSLSDEASCMAPAGLAVRENRVVVCHDIDSSESFGAWREAALARGFRAVISLPLRVDGGVVGSLNIYSTRNVSFLAEEARLLQELADDLSFGLSSLSARVRHERTEQHRRLSQSKFQRVFAQSSEGIALADDAGIVVDWNRAMELMTGFPAESCLGKPVLEVMESLLALQDDESVGLPQVVRRFVEHLGGLHEDQSGGRLEPIEVDLRRPDGEVRTVHVSFFPVDTGEDLYWGSICRDITSERHAATKARRAMDGAIHAIGRMTEMRDPYTSGHQLRVERLSRRIAEELGLLGDSLEALRVAASLHDIGKIGIPAEILAKPSALEEHEWGLIRRHPEVGYAVLAPIEFPWQIAEIVRQHHERMDGSGYPRGLCGDSILLEARILGVADVVEAMSSHRPYRPSLGIDAAIQEIERGSGVMYDSQVVDACVHVLSRCPDWETD